MKKRKFSHQELATILEMPFRLFVASELYGDSRIRSYPLFHSVMEQTANSAQGYWWPGPFKKYPTLGDAPVKLFCTSLTDRQSLDIRLVGPKAISVLDAVLSDFGLIREREKLPVYD